jgi:elongation factor Ts
MHVAAAAPQSLSEADLDPVVLGRERDVQTQRALEENASAQSPKPEAVIHNNIIPGRMKKFLEEVTLLNQKFVINPDVTVGQAAKDAGVEIVGFARLAGGQGSRRLRRRGRPDGGTLSPPPLARQQRIATARSTHGCMIAAGIRR